MKKLILGSLAISALFAASAANAQPPPPPIFTWTGFYVGLNAGAGWADADTSFGPLPSAAAFINLAPTTLHPDPSGGLFGGQIGFNMQSGMLVWGVEADIQWTNINGSVTQTPIIQNNGTPFPGAGFLQASQSTDWLGTLRARIGVSTTPSFLVYVTGGLAYGQVNYSAQTDFRPGGTTQYPAAISKTKAGWTVGAGEEWMFAPNWSFKVEYLYYDLGTESITVNAIPLLPPFQLAYNWQTRGSIARVGLNFKFP